MASCAGRRGEKGFSCAEGEGSDFPFCVDQRGEEIDSCAEGEGVGCACVDWKGEETERGFSDDEWEEEEGKGSQEVGVEHARCSDPEMSALFRVTGEEEEEEGGGGGEQGDSPINLSESEEEEEMAQSRFTGGTLQL